MVRGTNALDGLKKLYETHPDLIIVSRELPLVNGEDPCLRIRQASYLPIIVIGSQEYAAETLEYGADAYMVKPPNTAELVARVDALLRRQRKDDPPGGVPSLALELLIRNGNDGSCRLTGTEFCLASCLILNRGRLVEYSRIISEVWGGKRVSLDTLHFYIRSLRRKLSIGNILGIRGLGYCFEGLAETG